VSNRGAGKKSQQIFRATKDSIFFLAKLFVRWCRCDIQQKHVTFSLTMEQIEKGKPRRNNLDEPI
jgi:hypothetical protein